MSLGKYRYWDDDWNEAVKIVANLLTRPLMEAKEQKRDFYVWEREGLEFLSKMMSYGDPQLSMNAYVYDCVLEFERAQPKEPT